MSDNLSTNIDQELTSSYDDRSEGLPRSISTRDNRGNDVSFNKKVCSNVFYFIN